MRTSGTTSVPYYYEKNSFGDVTAIMSANNTVVATYSYDAWGNCTIGTDTDNIGQENAIRYRSYYWDNDLQLYYLQTRYYDPAIGRFVNADDVSYLDPDTLNGMNLYSYCLNNPVMYADPTGHFPILITLFLVGMAVIGAGVGGKIAYDKAVDTGKTGSDLFWSTVGGVSVGASAGLALGGLIVATGGAIYGAIRGISAIVPFVGLRAIQTFAIGAFAFNQFAFITAPILGVKMNGIETVPDGNKAIPPKPAATPKHRYGLIGLQWMFPFY